MKEEQSFHPFFIALSAFVAISVNFLLAYTAELNIWVTLLVMSLNSLLALIFIFSKLKTKYDMYGIDISFYPFMFKPRHIPWSDVSEAFIRKYSPLGDYGGWGLRFGGKKKGRAYNTKGNMGIQLVLKDGKKVLIGTQQENELHRYLESLISRGIVKAGDEVSE
ncbi:MAG: hypothetical protein KJO29_01800 [Bacteroidia bacterium]|nr:hypothetical protein [Bacteroidia bacterium]